MLVVSGSLVLVWLMVAIYHQIIWSTSMVFIGLELDKQGNFGG